jgi:hypothetical protein
MGFLGKDRNGMQRQAIRKTDIPWYGAKPCQVSLKFRREKPGPLKRNRVYN